ncbi:hypothetical protein [Allomesorhizobium alhagi]|uniref:hypothetical protein n=1 Tax=Allomesorhizobium alhagi TaxID=475067 RepID=UPI00111281B9|nr:hypothetical protein [Mesorhizobium alhagi]
MGEVEIRELPQFVQDACLTGFPEVEIENIKNRIQKNPTFGHNFLGLSHQDFNIPLAGFYVRSWKIRGLSGAWLEACTLHLYLGPDQPVYLFNMSSCLGHEVPWNEHKDILSATASAVFRALTKVES